MKDNNWDPHRRNFYKGWVLPSFTALFLVLGPLAEAADLVGSTKDINLAAFGSLATKAGGEIFSQTCSACHGGEGRGGKAPCITCGKFFRSGNTNQGIYNTIANGLPMTKMGGYSSSLSSNQILSIIAYLRQIEADRIKAGEISISNLKEKKALVFPK